jgi:site-specific recombinase XerD
MQKLSAERVEKFLLWLETERKSSISTRNLRLTAIHSFFRYAQAESPQALYHYQKVLAIPMKKKRQAIVVEHLSPEGITLHRTLFMTKYLPLGSSVEKKNSINGS